MTHPDIQCLQRIRSLSQFDAGQLEALAQRLEIVDATAGEMLMDHGYAERDSLYPIEGSLCALSRDGVETRFDAGADGELAAIARLRPSMYRVSAVGAARYLLGANPHLGRALRFRSTRSLRAIASRRCVPCPRRRSI